MDASRRMTGVPLAEFLRGIDDYDVYAASDYWDGEVIDVPIGTVGHSTAQSQISFALGQYLEDHDIGFAALSLHCVCSPDRWVLRCDAAAVLGPYPESDGPLPRAPDVAVEVLMEGDSAEYMARKAEAFLNGGSRMVWAIDSEQPRAWVYRAGGVVRELGADDEIAGEDVLPGFAVKVADVVALR